ncbi:MAG: TonB-dependent receptor plug domain-containing protein [Massilia sp.]
MLKTPVRCLLLAMLAAFSHGAAHAGGQERPGPVPAPALVDFSLEQLSDVVVTSLARQDTRLAEAPASIFLISGADIRRAGATSLPQALRLAPNLQVAQADNRNWSVTARGFGSLLENKLLVLIDGRSIYSPLFSGVFWDSQDVMMEDIERIEVISGPGATIWGSNAVNGVINIITRKADDSQGGLLVAERGSRNNTGAARWGGALGNGGHYRLYSRYTDAAGTDNEDGRGGIPAWHRRQAGMRADWDGKVHDVMLSADAYQGTLEYGNLPALRMSGANVVGRVTSELADGSRLRLQAYLDHVERNQDQVGSQMLDTVDLEAQHSVEIGALNHLTWGGGYRHLRDRFENGPILRFTPDQKSSQLYNLFAQDELRLRPDLRLTAGLRFEHNDYTGWEALPNLHLAWNLNHQDLLWTGISRTVRAPSRIDRDLFVVNPAAGASPGTPPYSIAGGPNFDAETARVLEAGYRAEMFGAINLSTTVFYSDYRRLRTLEPAGQAGPQFANLGVGSVRGIELWGRWQVRGDWRLSAGMVLQNVRSHLLPGSQDSSAMAGLATNDPTNTWSLRSSHDLAEHLQGDFALRHVGRLPDPAVPDYTEIDARLAWQPRPNTELSLAGQNLLHRSHVEFGAAGSRQRIERALALRLALRF